MAKLWKHAPFIVLAVIAALGLSIVATTRGEEVSALWIVFAAASIYVIAYRYYSKFIAERVMKLDEGRVTPAVRLTDGLDYVPTNKYVLFGHHFAAIAGAGPLVGPVLAAQMGYLPGLLWLVTGVVLGGAVQDFTILFISMRRDGRSLGELIRSEIGVVPGLVALFGAFIIMVILLAVLALIVVKSLADSPWGTFTVAATIPIALFMGVYARFIRPGKIGEVSLIGLALLMLSIVFGQNVAADPTLAAIFTLTATQLCWALIVYGFIAAVLPVWLLLAPRDYVSTFLKIGAILSLAIGIIVLAPSLKMPAVSVFMDGTGPVWKGTLFPFLFITIACGAVSGFHALVASGTTPKLLANERDARFVGYGAMLMESFVAVMALVAASILEPGIYFAMNSPPAVVGTTAESASLAVEKMGFPVSAETIVETAREVGETTIISRTGGAPTLAVGMAHVFAAAFGGPSAGGEATAGSAEASDTGGKGMKAFWYHFAILFEALFILTAVDAGTRAGRFMLQDLIGTAVPSFRATSAWIPAITSTGIVVGLWGFFLYQGVTDPLGGINTLWPLFGMANQMLAAIALTLATVVFFKMKRERHAWITGVPTVWLVTCTMAAGLAKLFSDDPAIGFNAHARRFSAALERGEIVAPAQSLEQMSQVVANDYINAAMCVVFMAVVVAIVGFGIRASFRALRSERWTALELPLTVSE